jgi:hypothetical protein
MAEQENDIHSGLDIVLLELLQEAVYLQGLPPVSG